MKTLLAVLLLAGASLFAAGAPKREVFPSDYTPQSCAPSAEAVCESFPMRKITEFAAAFRRFDIDGKWVDDHGEEMRQAFLPLCGKIGHCYTVAQNDSVFCWDLALDDFMATCNRFPAGSRDFDQCTMFAKTYYIGLGAKLDLHKQTQSCAAQTPSAGERTLTYWMTPETIGPEYNGKLTIYAFDAETKLPVKANVSMDSLSELRYTQGPVTTAGYMLLWEGKPKRVPNAEGHRDVIAPTVKLEAKGYQPLTFEMPMTIPKMILEMTPAANRLKRGKNSLTITARDAETGKPVEARVMAGDIVLGDTNKPLELEIARGEKRPEIWVTSLFDRYSDVVVAPAQK
ncbi:MAG TPA: hypothetical protein VEK57_03980 [Thermoanaerobaculia bacterium]|nr:hypothetical protein [Thermoanaerobaculia bacterium]